MPQNLRAQQPSAAALGGQAHVNRGGVEVVPGMVGALHVHAHGVESQGVGFTLGQAGAGHAQIEGLEDAAADDAGKLRLAARHIDARDPAHPVGGEAQRHMHLAPGDALHALGVVACRVDMLHVGLLAGVDADGPGGAEPHACGLGQRHVGPHPDRHHHQIAAHQAAARLHACHPSVFGGQRLHGHAAAHVHAVFFQFQTHPALVAQIENAPGHPRPAFEQHHAQPARAQRLGQFQPNVTAAHDDGPLGVFQAGLGSLSVGNVAQHVNARWPAVGAVPVHIGPVGAHGRHAGGEQQAVIRLAANRSAGFAHRERLGFAVNPGHLVAELHADALAAHPLGRAGDQFAKVLDLAADDVGQAARAVTDVPAALEHHHFGVRILALGTGGRAHARRHAAHDDYSHGADYPFKVAANPIEGCSGCLRPGAGRWPQLPVISPRVLQSERLQQWGRHSSIHAGDVYKKTARCQR